MDLNNKINDLTQKLTSNKFLEVIKEGKELTNKFPNLFIFHNILGLAYQGITLLEDAEKCLGVSAENQDVTSGELNPDAYRDVLSKLSDNFGFKKIGITLRESISASDNNWSAIYSDNGNIYVGNKYSIHMVDRVGGGDAFSAGIIYGNLMGMSSEDTLNFAVASSALAHTIHGDLNLVTLSEVNSIVKGDTSGRVQR